MKNIGSGIVVNETLRVELRDADNQVSTNVVAYQVKIRGIGSDLTTKGSFILNTIEGIAEFDYLFLIGDPGSDSNVFDAYSKDLDTFHANDL